MKSIVTYQGGKSRLAPKILDIIRPEMDGRIFVDACCGSGAVAIEAVNRGKPAYNIAMVDSGPWGELWSRIRVGFSIDDFAQHLNEIPKDPRDVHEYVSTLSKLPIDDGTYPYVFLILQAAAFGGKAIGEKDGRWTNTTFRSYWEPTATSSRRSPVNPMMPMPETMLQRAAEVSDKMSRVRATRSDILNISLENYPCVVYIDPPYKGTTAYNAEKLDIVQFVNKNRHQDIYVSEGYPLQGADKHYLLSEGRSKGGISGDRKEPNQEWLSFFARK